MKTDGVISVNIIANYICILSGNLPIFSAVIAGRVPH